MGFKEIVRFLEKLLTVGGIAGLIALMIAGAIAGRYFAHGPEAVPDVLTYSLTTIIGFYFGATVSSSPKKPAESGPLLPST